MLRTPGGRVGKLQTGPGGGPGRSASPMVLEVFCSPGCGGVSAAYWPLPGVRASELLCKRDCVLFLSVRQGKGRSL